MSLALIAPAAPACLRAPVVVRPPALRRATRPRPRRRPGAPSLASLLGTTPIVVESVDGRERLVVTSRARLDAEPLGDRFECFIDTSDTVVIYRERIAPVCRPYSAPAPLA